MSAQKVYKLTLTRRETGELEVWVDNGHGAELQFDYPVSEETTVSELLMLSENMLMELGYGDPRPDEEDWESGER